jgi:hypothetical protein
LFKKGISESALEALGMIAQSKLRNQFYLAEGTAAAIQIGHRLSLDLDYFSPDPFKSEDLIKILRSADIQASRLAPSEGTLNCVVNGTKVSFLYYEYPLLEKTRRFQRTDLASLLDIVLMKMTAIASRGLKKDFIDLYFILKEIPLQRILDNFSVKYPLERIDPYHYLLSLTYFDDADRDPMPRMLVECDWREVKEFLKMSVSKISL